MQKTNLQAVLCNAKTDYDRDGYIARYSLIGPSEMVEINTQLDQFILNCVPQMSNTEVYYEEKGNSGNIKQMMNMNKHSAYFRDLVENSVMRDLAAELLGENVRAVNVEYFNKPPGIGKPTPAHQDGYFFHLSPSKAVTCWLALEDVDDENGCIHYVRGSHKAEGFRQHSRSNILGFSQGMTDFGTALDKDNTVSFPCGAGTLLAHDSKTVHWAGANQSNTRSRRALGFVYFAESAKHDKIASDAYQAKLHADLRDAKKI